MNIEVIASNKTYNRTYAKSILISDILKDCGLDFDLPCGGIGRCLKCKILVSGATSAMTDVEHKTLTKDEVCEGYRYACQTYITGDATVYYNTTDSAIQGLTYGFLPDFEKKSNNSQQTKNLGVSIDIGTTTIAMHLYELTTYRLLHSSIQKNAQIQFGSDVMSRINFSLLGKTQEMHAVVATQVDQMVRSLIEDVGLAIESLGSLVVTGNTTMLHLFCNIPTELLSAFPFVTDELFGRRINAKEIGLSFDCDLYLARSISGFVGADITCGILSSDMIKTKASILVDIGTNGEIVLNNNGELFACSTAAGPAFEGGNISMGSSATSGAISRVYLEDGLVKYSVIGDGLATSICGSGIIDIVSVLFDLGVMEPSGLIYEGEQTEFVIPNSNIIITQRDLRQIQLAKSALISGILTLIHEANLTVDDIEVLYLSGGFSMFIDMGNAANIGLIPAELKDRIKILGNSSLSGADMLLLGADTIAFSERIARETKTVSLETNSFFMDTYVSNMEFLAP